MIYIPDQSVCGEVAEGEVELSELSRSENVNRTMMRPTVTQLHTMHFNWWREARKKCHQQQGGRDKDENSSETV